MPYVIYFEFGDRTTDYITIYSERYLHAKLSDFQKSHLFRKLRYGYTDGKNISNWIEVNSFFDQAIFNKYQIQVQQEYQRHFKDRTK